MNTKARPIHGAYVEEYTDDEGDRYFVATCAETFVSCDAFAFPDVVLSGWSGDHGEAGALARALEYLGGRGLHEFQSPNFCDADHIHVAALDAIQEEENRALLPLLEAAAGAERARIRKTQAPALRNLRVLLMPECSDENVNGERLGAFVPRHADDCPKEMMLEALRWLRAATRRPR